MSNEIQEGSGPDGCIHGGQIKFPFEDYCFFVKVEEEGILFILAYEVCIFLKNLTWLFIC